MAYYVQTEKPAKTGDKFYYPANQNTSVHSNVKARNIQYMGIEHVENKTGRQGTTVKATNNIPSKMRGSHRQRGGFHERNESPSVDGNWGSANTTQKVGEEVQTTSTPQDTGVMVTDQLLRKEDGSTVGHPLLNGRTSLKNAPRGNIGLPRLTPGFSRRRLARQGPKVREVSRGKVLLSVVRSDALWPGTLTPKLPDEAHRG